MELCKASPLSLQWNDINATIHCRLDYTILLHYLLSSGKWRHCQTAIPIDNTTSIQRQRMPKKLPEEVCFVTPTKLAVGFGVGVKVATMGGLVGAVVAGPIVG